MSSTRTGASVASMLLLKGRRCMTLRVASLACLFVVWLNRGAFSSPFVLIQAVPLLPFNSYESAGDTRRPGPSFERGLPDRSSEGACTSRQSPGRGFTGTRPVPEPAVASAPTERAGSELGGAAAGLCSRIVPAPAKRAGPELGGQPQVPAQRVPPGRPDVWA